MQGPSLIPSCFSHVVKKNCLFYYLQKQQLGVETESEAIRVYNMCIYSTCVLQCVCNRLQLKLVQRDSTLRLLCYNQSSDRNFTLHVHVHVFVSVLQERDLQRIDTLTGNEAKKGKVGENMTTPFFSVPAFDYQTELFYNTIILSFLFKCEGVH